MQQTSEKDPKRFRRMLVFFAAIIVVVGIIVGITGSLIYNGLSRPRHDAKAVAPNVSVAPFVTLQGESNYPIGLAAVPDGSFYLSIFGNKGVLKVDQQGATSQADIPTNAVTVGGAITVDTDGILYVVNYSSAKPTEAFGTLRKITSDGKSSTLGTGLPLFAELALDNANNLYVTNPSTGQIWRCVPDGNCTISWFLLPPVNNIKAQPTGIAYDAANKALIVADAGTGSLYRLTLKEDGNPGDSLLLNRETGLRLQSVALDQQNRVLFTVWRGDNGQLNRLEQSGVITILADNFRAPTSMAVQNGKVYVVNSDLFGIAPPIFGVIPQPYQAKPPFTVDVVSVSS